MSQEERLKMIADALDASRAEHAENDRKARWNAICPVDQIQPYENKAFLNLVGVMSSLLGV